MGPLLFYSTQFLDRHSLQRQDDAWVQENLHGRQSYLIPVYQGKNLFQNRRAAFIPSNVVISKWTEEQQLILLGTFDQKTYYAWNLADPSTANYNLQSEWGNLEKLRQFDHYLPSWESALLGYANAMIYWHETHRYCGNCGSITQSLKAGHVRRCTNESCGQEHFPRTNPAIIVRVENEDRILLARKPHWLPFRYSVLAGFIEPLETMEAAVVREVKEEVGLRVQNVSYLASQPWPFPASLMLGYTAESVNEDIYLDDDELEHAAWWTRAEVAEGLKKEH